MNYLRIYENFINSNLLYCIQTKKTYETLNEKKWFKTKTQDG
jgi:hypothetical protein